MARRRNIVFLDTTAIIEAHRVGIWRQLSEAYELTTVEKCLEEIETGNLVGGDKVVIETVLLRSAMTIAQVQDEDRVAAAVESKFQLASIDDGERDLLAGAFRLSSQEDWVLSSQDKACIRVGTLLGMIERFVSLQELAEAVHARPREPFREQFTNKWLSRIRTMCRLGTL